MSWLTPGHSVREQKEIVPTDDTPPVIGDAVLCFPYETDASFVGLIVGSGVYEDEHGDYDYFDVKRADGHILMLNPGDVRRLSDVK